MCVGQVNKGTVIYLDFEPGEVTIAADSRTTDSAGHHDDQECKISAFGDRFLFTMAGIVFDSAKGWNAHTVAREIWAMQSTLSNSSDSLASAVAGEWITRMESLYADPILIQEFLKFSSGEPVLANALFAATDDVGGLKVIAADIDFDKNLFETSGLIKVTHDSFSMPVNAWGSGGHSDIVEEFRLENTDRAKNYMKQFRSDISSLPLSEQRASLAAKYVEMSILLDPQKEQLGFPVDVAQLRRDNGVHWMAIKPNCPRN